MGVEPFRVGGRLQPRLGLTRIAGNWFPMEKKALQVIIAFLAVARRLGA